MPFLLALLVITLTSLFGWHVMSQPGYSSGSPTGYNLGLAGAIMMLTLFLYPLRKHVRWLNAVGQLRKWLSVHMLLGICGPLLILFHSRFEIDSINAGVAMASMIVVSSSGIVGRFFYTRIHHGLRGRRLAAIELRVALAEALVNMAGGKSLPASAKQILESYEAYVERTPGGFISRTLKFLTIGWRRMWVVRRIRHQLIGFPGTRHVMNQIENYLQSLQRVAQFTIYERLFSLWHLLHIPLVALLLLSAVFHVLAVHMY